MFEYRKALFLTIPFVLLQSGCDLFSPPPVAPLPPPPTTNPYATATAMSALSPPPGFDFPVLKGVVEELRLKFPSSPPTLLTYAFGKSIEEVTKTLNIDLGEFRCLVDYSLPCPLGWSDLGDAETCMPPDGYVNEDDDSCSKDSKLAKLTVTEKRAFADRCRSDWPCKDACVQDFDQPCPFNWYFMRGLCMAPFNYRGRCVTTYNFAQHNTHMRKEWARICAVTWPCKIKPKVFKDILMMPPIHEESRIHKLDTPQVQGQ